MRPVPKSGSQAELRSVQKEEAAIGAECQRTDASPVLAQGQQQGSAGSVPDSDRPVAGARGDPPAVRTEAQGRDAAGVAAHLPQPFPALHLPHFQGPVLPARRQVAPVGCPRDALRLCGRWPAAAVRRDRRRSISPIRHPEVFRRQLAGISPSKTWTAPFLIPTRFRPCWVRKRDEGAAVRGKRCSSSRYPSPRP